MALNIRNAEMEQLPQALARLTGEGKTEARPECHTAVSE